MERSYSHLAAVYDSLMYDMDYESWAEYIAGFLKEIGAKTVFETACGTGNITIPLVKHGFSVTAADISTEMLEVAGEKARRAGVKSRFVCQDMRHFSIGNKVDAVVSACDGVNYLQSYADCKRFFDGAFAALKSGGVLLFDISSEHKIKDILKNNLFFDDGDEVTYFWQNTLLENMLTMDITLFIKNGESYTRADETHVQTAFETEKLLELLRESGFEAQAFSFLTREPAQYEDERIQFKAVKL